MLRFKYRYCKARMAAYLNGELTPKARRRMARYIAERADCYAEYRRQLDLTQELEARMGGFGRAKQLQLNRMWSGIQSEIAAMPPVQETSVPVHRHARYGIVVLVLIMTLLLPWTLGNRNVASHVPSQPAPRLIIMYETPERLVMHYTLVETLASQAAPSYLRLRNTPEPSTR